jgi:hypothetical protein
MSMHSGITSKKLRVHEAIVKAQAEQELSHQKEHREEKELT